MSQPDILTGADLLAILEEMSPEDLAKRVRMEGCDCDGLLGVVDAEGKELYLARWAGDWGEL